MKIKLSLLFLLSSYQLNIPSNPSQKSIPKQIQPSDAQPQSQEQDPSVNNASSNSQKNAAMSSDQLQQWWNSLPQEEQEKLKIGAGITGGVVTGKILRKLYNMSKENYKIYKKYNSEDYYLTWKDQPGKLFSIEKPDFTTGFIYKKNVLTDKDLVLTDKDLERTIKGGYLKEMIFDKNNNQLVSKEKQLEQEKKDVINKYDLAELKKQKIQRQRQEIKQFGVYSEAEV